MLRCPETQPPLLSAHAVPTPHVSEHQHVLTPYAFQAF